MIFQGNDHFYLCLYGPNGCILGSRIGIVKGGKLAPSDQGTYTLTAELMQK